MVDGEDEVVKVSLKEVSSPLETAIDILEVYGMDPNKFKDNLVEMQFNPSKTDLLADIPLNIKSALTKKFNLRHKTSLKAAKKKVAPLTVNEDQALRQINPEIEEEVLAEQEMEVAEQSKVGEEDKYDLIDDRCSRPMRTDMPSRNTRKKIRTQRRNFNNY